MSANPFDATPEALRAESTALRRLSRALLGHEQDAEDVAQETWLAALQDPPQRGAWHSAWLARVARNFALRIRHKDEARRRWERAAARPESTPSTVEALERVALHQQIVLAVLALDEPYRSTVVLRFWEDRPPRDVARQMGVPVSTVRTRVRRALVILRERLDDSFGDRAAWSGMLAFVSENARCATTTPSASLALVGALLMTSKIKLATLGAFCLVLFVALWVVTNPSAERLLVDPNRASGGSDMNASGGSMNANAAAENPPARTEMHPSSKSKPAFGSLLVRARWGADQSIAANVTVRPWYSAPRRIPVDDFNGVTDEAGTLRIDNLRPGTMYVQSDRGHWAADQKKVMIVAEKETEVAIEIPVGLNLSGIVVDEHGMPVADAEIVVAKHGPKNARSTARSDGDGRFHLRSIGVHCYVGARARGYVPSPLHTIEGKEGDEREVRIVLRSGGGALVGRVLGPSGQPVRQALIYIGEPGSARTQLTDNQRGIAPMPMRLRSDKDGRFSLDGLASGRQKVAMWARGLAPWFGAIDIVAGDERELLVGLLPAATVLGTVRDSGGTPLAKVSVEAACEGDWWFGPRRTDSTMRGSPD